MYCMDFIEIKKKVPYTGNYQILRYSTRTSSTTAMNAFDYPALF